MGKEKISSKKRRTCSRCKECGEDYQIHFTLNISFNDNQSIYGLNDVKIYDTEKGFVTAQRIIRNISNDWLDINFSNGRRLLCTTDHVLTLRSGNNVQASNLKIGDKLLINSNQYTEETILFNTDKAWLLGFMLCDGCYQNNHVFASIAASDEDEIEEKFNNGLYKIFRFVYKNNITTTRNQGYI